MTKLFHLRVTDAHRAGKIGGVPWFGYYTSISEFIVRAEDEGQARVIASANEYYFINPDCATCAELSVEGPAEIIIMNEPTG